MISKIKLSKNPSNQRLEVIQEAREEDNIKSSNAEEELKEELKLQETPSMASLSSQPVRAGHQPVIIPSSQIFQQRQLAQKVEVLEQDKARFQEELQRQHLQYQKEKDQLSQIVASLETKVHKIENEKDKLQLKYTQAENQIQKLKQKIQGHEQETESLKSQLIDKERELVQKHEEAYASS